MGNPEKYLGMLVEYLDEGRLRPALVVREQSSQIVTLDANGRERPVPRDLVMVRHSDRRPNREQVGAALAALEAERAQLAAELDLNLLWEVVREHERSYTAEELAELFFGRRSPVAAAVMLDALFADRLYFVRRHMDFVARSSEQVERLRLQYERMRMRSEGGRRLRQILQTVLEGGALPAADEAAPLITELKRYLENPFTRSRELTMMLEAATNEVSPAEAAYEILERLGETPDGPRFAIIGGLRGTFSEAALTEASAAVAPARSLGSDGEAITIDDEETVEIDDAISCEPLEGGNLRVRVHIALVADLVAKGSAMDAEAASRGATVYLPETTIRMLPDAISTGAGSLVEGQPRHVLTTEVTLSPSGEAVDFSIYPEALRVKARLDYDRADQLLMGEANGGGGSVIMLRRLLEATNRLRERRRNAGAILMQRREPKIRVSEGKIEVKLIDTASPSRQLVAELMVLSNYCGARFAADRHVPMIYRVQPSMGEAAMQRPRLSLYPEFHSGVGLDFYAQLSSPIRRYMDLVLQRQIVAALGERRTPLYEPDELLAVLAAAENAESEGRELERRAKRYWLLRYLQLHQLERPLEAIVLRDGASAEIEAYAVRGALHGAPNVASHARILVRIARVEPLRGWLTLDYLSNL
ncbi:MAG TPA: ribonuclease catalytic domain-containing protein [Candidatus Binataceae bacterium]|nr:ribonuclease catalytic domain-containing protein [Candidatus Binataceae bacterium]